jgi:mono/diheme cytochrome c family protein
LLKFVFIPILALTTSAAAQSSLQRGDYLVNAVMACDGCHTPRDSSGFVMEKRFSGGSQTWDVPEYTVKGSNITPDPDTGIGRWSESDIKISLTEGLRPYGMPIAPQMPFTFYKIMTPRDLEAVVAYLRSIPAVRNAVQPPIYRATPKLEVIPGADKPLDESALRSYSAGVLPCHPRALHGVSLTSSRWRAGFFELVWKGWIRNDWSMGEGGRSKHHITSDERDRQLE